MHQSISTMVVISLRENPPNKFEERSSLVHSKCMAAQYAIRATVNTTLQNIPGELAFRRNMLHPFSSKINWSSINKKELIISISEKIKVKRNLTAKWGRRF